jgi:hypothetical protein
MSPAHAVAAENAAGHRFRSFHQRLTSPHKFCLFDLIRATMAAMLDRNRRSRTNGQAAFGLFRFQSKELQTLAIIPRVLAKVRNEVFGCHVDQDPRPVQTSQLQIPVSSHNADLI